MKTFTEIAVAEGEQLAPIRTSMQKHWKTEIEKLYQTIQSNIPANIKKI